VAAATEVWPDHTAGWPGQPRQPEDDEPAADPDPAESDGYEPI
jgi:hypothetical protein